MAKQANVRSHLDAIELLNGIDLGLLKKQIATLATIRGIMEHTTFGECKPDAPDHVEGLLNLLGWIHDVIDPPTVRKA